MNRILCCQSILFSLSTFYNRYWRASRIAANQFPDGRRIRQRNRFVSTIVLKQKFKSLLKDTRTLARVGFQPALQQKIVFLHVPKCGGTSLDIAIQQSFGRRNLRPRGVYKLDPAVSAAAAKLANMPIADYRENLLFYYLGLEDAYYVKGHFTFSDDAYRTFSALWHFISLIREPTARWISHYFFNRYKQDDHFRIEIPLEDFVETDRGRSLGHNMVSFFGGSEVRGKPISQASLDAAIANVERLSVVGVLEHLDKFAVDYERRFGVRLRIDHRNRNPVNNVHEHASLTPSMLRKIESVCEPDIALYQHVLNHRLGK